MERLILPKRDTKGARVNDRKRHPICVKVAQTPIGAVTLAACENRLVALRFGEAICEGELPEKVAVLEQAYGELWEYFSGKRRTFDVPLLPTGTEFQKIVWQVLLAGVPYGKTISYGELARRCGHPGAARAVGGANHHNPIPIFIPCHRVIGVNGALVGYGGGVPIKQALLSLEKDRDP